MQQGSITALHIARVKGTPSYPVQRATAISGKGLEGDRSCNADNARQVLVMDQETLNHLELEPGQIKENITTTGLDLSQVKEGQVLFIGDEITMEFVGPCLPCHKMDQIRPGLQDRLKGQRGMLAVVLNGGTFKVGDPVRVEP
jgi:MOSC domain-containing protein YiiM